MGETPSEEPGGAFRTTLGTYTGSASQESHTWGLESASQMPGLGQKELWQI